MTLAELIATPEVQRDSQWENLFLKSFTESKLKVLIEEPQKGPDGWPYLVVEASDEQDAESAQKVLAWLQKRGIGCVLNPQKEYPDYVFTWGMIWSFRETGWFFKPQKSENTKIDFALTQDQILGAPTEEYLPSYVRQVLKEFFLQQNIYRPQILVLSNSKNEAELLISKQSLGNPPESEHEGILEAIAWFLPPHYNLALVDSASLKTPFIDL